MIELTKEQLQVLQHALGVDQYGRGSMYRNFFAAGVDDVPVCESLESLGFMKKVATTRVFPDVNFRVTKEGERAMIDNSPKPPVLTRGQKRYQRFLQMDGLFDSFKDFLKYESEHAK